MDDTDDLPLRDGLLRWCDPALVAAATEASTRAAAIRPPPSRPAWLDGASREETRGWTEARRGEDRIRTAAADAWRAVIIDFRRRLEQADLILTGVQTMPTREVDRRAIPGAWAADFTVKADEGVIEFADYRYVAVRLSLRRPNHGESPAVVAQPLNVEDLDDETILRLLTENVERVARSDDAKLFPPGKLSLMPIVKRKLQARAEAGELLPTLRAESEWLEGWIRERAPTLHLPSAKTIGTVLGAEYAKLKPGSTPPIQ